MLGQSIAPAEIVGPFSGIAGGMIGVELCQSAARSLGIPEAPARIIGAGIGHYLGNAGVKLLINAGLLDATGAGVNLVVTSPAGAITHAGVQSVREVINYLNTPAAPDHFLSQSLLPPDPRA